MKTYIKLYGPSIDKAFEALDELLKNLNKRYPYGESVSHIISVIDPNYDLHTGTLISSGRMQIGDYDYAIEWKQPPQPDEVRSLLRRLDDALIYTGCRYTTTTK